MTIYFLVRYSEPFKNIKKYKMPETVVFINAVTYIFYLNIIVYLVCKSFLLKVQKYFVFRNA